MEQYPTNEIEEYRISFDSFEYAFSASRLVGDAWRFRPNELSVSELRAVANSSGPRDHRLPLKYKRRRHYESHLQRLLAVPFTPLLFAIAGVPLAIFGFVGSRAKGLLAALALLGVYYALFIFCYEAARSGRFPPAPAVWFPNALLFVGATVLLLVSARTQR
jgi:lipopolysaccharide export LptBFGC system permease protein LptF